MAVDLVRMPPEIARGFTSRLDFVNTVVRLPGGLGREVVRERERPARTWVATKGLFKSTRADEFMGFARARHGAFYGFLLTDVSEFSTNPSNPKGAWTNVDQYLGEADGTKVRFPIRRTYTSTADDLLQRLGVEDRIVPYKAVTDARLAKVVGVTPATSITSQVARNGVSVGAFEIDFIKREFVLPTPPAAGAMTWGGYYGFPVAFSDETDRNLERVAESWTSDTVPSIEMELLEHERFIAENDDPGGAETITFGAGTVPLITKPRMKHWLLDPTAGSLKAQLDDPASVYSAGGPHLFLYNISAFSLAIVDWLTGATIFTLGAAGSSTCNARLIVRDNGSSVQWHVVLSG